MNFLKHTIGLTYVALVCVFLLLPKVVFGVDISTVYESIQTKKIINTVYQKPVFNLDRLKVSPRVSAAQKASISDAVKSAYSKLINFGSKAFEPIYVEQSTPVLNTPAQKVITTKANTPSVVSNPKNQVVPVNSNNVLAVQLSELRKRINDLEKKGNVVVQPITQNVYNSYVTSGYSYSQPSRDAVSTQQVTVDIESAIAPLREQIANISSGTSTISTGSVSTSTIRSMFSSSASGLGYDSASGIFSLVSGYVIPTTASTTEWMTAYTNRITSASGPLSIASNSISISKASSTADGYLSSTDWNTFNNKVSSQWTTSGSNVYYTTGNVGVGTTTPDSKLSVAGDINLTGALRFNGSAGTSGYILQSTGTGAQWVATSTLGLSGGSGSQWNSSGSDINFMTGNVGIGTTTPSAKLTIVGDGYLSGTLTAGLLNITGTGTSTINSNIVMSGDIIPSTDITYTLGTPQKQWKDVYIGPGSLYINGQKVLQEESQSIVVTADLNQNLVMRTAGTGDIELNPSGTGLVQLKGNVQLSAGYDISTSNNSAVSFSDGIRPGNISLSANKIITTNTNGSLELSATGTGAIYTGIGNFGIGTTTPGYALTVAGDTNITGALRFNGSAGTSGMVLQSTGTGAQWVATSTLGLGGGSSQWTTTGSDIYYTTGNVGIGVTSPQDKLAVSGNIYASLGLSVGGGSATTTGTRTAISPGLLVGYSGTEATGRWRLGNAGITNGVGGLVFDSGLGGLSGGGGGGIGQSVLRTVSLYTGDGSTLVERLRVDGSGNVGIGTTTAASRLSVAGDINFTGALKTNGDAGTSGYILQSTGTGAQWVATSSLGITGGGGGSSQWTTTGSDIYYTTGNVGVGTTTPGSKLAITGTAGSTNDLLIVATSTNARYFTITSTGNVGIGSTTPAAALHITRANSANEVEYMRFSSSNAATAGDEFSSYWYSGNSTTKLAKMSVVNEGSSKAGFRFGVTNDGGATTPNRLVISGDGNVGIGNNVTPQALLHLARTNTTSGAEWELMRYSLTGSSFTGDELSTYWYTQGSTHKLAKMSVINEGGGKAGFRFGTTNDGAVTTPNRVAITGDGRLGVGLVNPQTALEVVGSASTTALYIPATQSATIGTLNLGGSRFLHAYTAASVFVGPNAGNFTSTGSYNTGVGSLALTAVTSGHSNVGIGPSALAGVTIGVRNVGIGYLAIGSGTNGGNDNIAIGYGALGATSVTGSNNTVVGNANAARAIGSGSGNTLYGYGVGYSTSGSYNNFFGFQSGYGVTTGSRNILLGASTLVASYNQITTGSNNISIGNDVAVASTTASNQLNIGNLIYGTNLNGTGSTVSTGNIGIGTTTPWAKLTVAGEVNSTFFSAASTTATSTFAGGLNVGGGALIHDWNTGVTTIANASLGAATFESDSGIISWIDMPVTSDASNGTVQSYSAQLDGTPVLTVYGTSNGSGGVSNLRVGIGTSTPSSALTVNGEAYTYSSSANIGFSAEYTGASGRKYSLLSCYNCGSAGLGGFEVYDSTAAATRAYIQAGVNGWQTPSDRRLKDDIRTLNVLDKIDSIRGASYVLKDSNIPQIGVIAQEIKAAFPEAVSGEEVNGKYLGVSYNAIASIALQGVRELNDALKVVQSRVASMFAWFGPSGDMFNVKGNVCVDDVCVTKDQFKQMLINSGNTTTYTPSQSVPIVEDTTAASSTDPAGGVVESPQPAEESNTEPTAASGGSDTAVSSAEPAPTVTDSVVESAPADSGAATTE